MVQAIHLIHSCSPIVLFESKSFNVDRTVDPNQIAHLQRSATPPLNPVVHLGLAGLLNTLA